MKKVIKKVNIVILILFPIMLTVILIVNGPSLVESCRKRGEPLPINLDEFSLDTVTEEEIINYDISRSYRKKTKKNFISTKEMTGIYAVSSAKAVDCTLELNISAKLNGGKAKIVVIRDNEIVEYLDFGGDVQRVYEVQGEHLYVVKLVCEQAAVEVTVTRNLR